MFVLGFLSPPWYYLFINSQEWYRVMAAGWAIRAVAVIVGVGLYLGPALPSSGNGTPDTVKGPIEAKVIRVLDGDTLVVRARPWVGVEVETRVRLLGVDTPELRGGCEEERRLAVAARELLETTVAGGTVFLHEVRHDKYGGRVLARVETPSGADCADALIAAGLARPYGGQRRRPWCP